MDYDAVHLAREGSTVDAGVVLDRIHIYKDIARYYTLALEVAIIEGDYIGIGHCILGYRDCESPVARERKANYIYRV